ncbi:MAG: hypothetical protein HY677_03080 [Chloroflexi bacterium]|nr:hypothetical protein [Chloroflexota bacterium]
MTLRVLPRRRVYRRRMTLTWWVKNPRYVNYILREASSAFLTVFAVLYIVQFALLAAGAGPYGRYLAFIKSPAWVALNVIILIFALIHTVSWMFLATAATPVRIGAHEAPSWALTISGLVIWLAISVGVGYVILRG